MQRSLLALFVAGMLLSASHVQGQNGKGIKVPIESPKKIGEPSQKKTGAPAKTTTGGAAGVVPSIPGDVEIQFLNGSRIRAIIMTDKLEIISIYGKLAVPIQDVQTIEFGLHYPEGMEDKIDVALKGLGAGDYRTREKSAKALTDCGPFAYPALLRSSRVKETEVAARAKDLVQKFQTKYSKKDLKVSTDDRVVTPTQTLVGRIVTATVKTKAEYFGEIEHKLANMRSLRAFTSSAPDIDVAIDAGKYANAGAWMDSTFQLDGRSRITITCKGAVDTWPQQPGQYMVGPGGNSRRAGLGGGFDGLAPGTKIRLQGNNNNQLYGGMLVGKIGEDGEPFIIGERYEFKSEAEGKLYLHIVPSPWNCASAGTYDVKLSRKSD